MNSARRLCTPTLISIPTKLPHQHNITIIHNKCELVDKQPEIISGDPSLLRLSAKSGLGIDLLKQHLKQCMGYVGAGEGGFTARRRHINALERAREALQAGQSQLSNYGAGELLADDLRVCQNALSEITGEFTPDDLLGEIFSSFCIGK